MKKMRGGNGKFKKYNVFFKKTNKNKLARDNKPPSSANYGVQTWTWLHSPCVSLSCHAHFDDSTSRIIERPMKLLEVQHHPLGGGRGRGEHCDSRVRLGWCVKLGQKKGVEPKKSWAQARKEDRETVVKIVRQKQ